MAQLMVKDLEIQGARIENENPLPYFRDPQPNRLIDTIQPFPDEKSDYLGWETGFRVLPYQMQDQYTRQKGLIKFKSIVLENEILCATFLPELGGRLISLYDKPHQRELLHRNPVFQPANLAIRNAWFSGGIEWNVGQYGHTFTTYSPVFAAKIQDAHGEPVLRIYEFERCKRLFWQIDFYLPPQSPFLIAYTRILNPNLEDTSMYWWTNIAVDERSGTRILAPAEHALYSQNHSFGFAQLPYLPSFLGKDGTYSLNATFASEFFFQCDQADMPWEAALDKNGAGLIEASTTRLKYRKMFCWGTHPGGRHWQEFLSRPGEAYLEIQAGLAPTQVHGLSMPAETSWDWTQVFGYFEGDPGQIHSLDWPSAWSYVDRALKNRLSSADLNRIETNCRSGASLPPVNLLNIGSGWGALENKRRNADKLTPLPPSFMFPDESLGAEQKKWLSLMEHGILPEQNPSDLPGEWLVQPEWEKRLQESVDKNEEKQWFSCLHLGVMKMERFDLQDAEQAWRASIDFQPSIWAYRNLAVLNQRQDKADLAIEAYEKAWRLADGDESLQAVLATEYLQALIKSGQHQKAKNVIAYLPARVQNTDRVQILLAQVCLALGDLDSVETILHKEFAVVREGEIVLTDLWFDVQVQKEANRTGKPINAIVRKEIELRYPPPYSIDFRSS